MLYHISRARRKYGPFPEELVREMVREGRVAPADLCWAEGMEGWLPVSRAFGMEEAAAQAAAPVEAREESREETPREVPEEAPPAVEPGATAGENPEGEIPAGAGESAPGTLLPVAVPEAWRKARERREAPRALQPEGLAPGFSAWPVPPGLHWVLVLALSYATCGLFFSVWPLVQLSFVRKLDPKNPAAVLILGSVVAALASYFAEIFAAGTPVRWIFPLLFWAGIAQLMAAALLMRRSLILHYNTVEKTGLQLNPVLACMFSALYFQYHFSRIARWRKTGRIG
jgi:hypothetical protein